MLPPQEMDPLLDAAAEAVEESILNALTAGETTTGVNGVLEALPLDELVEIMRAYKRL
jgi:D-aminopeptidase